MLQRTGEAETITTHYLFALGIYRALYIPNWISRWYFVETPVFWDPISVIAGIIQTILYSDFFWIYYTKYATPFVFHFMIAKMNAGLSRAKNSTFQYSSSALRIANLFVGLSRLRLGASSCNIDRKSSIAHHGDGFKLPWRFWWHV